MPFIACRNSKYFRFYATKFCLKRVNDVFFLLPTVSSPDFWHFSDRFTSIKRRLQPSTTFLCWVFLETLIYFIVIAIFLFLKSFRLIVASDKKRTVWKTSFYFKHEPKKNDEKVKKAYECEHILALQGHNFQNKCPSCAIL